MMGVEVYYMGTKNSQSAMTAARLPLELRDSLDAYCKAHKVGRTEVIQRALELYLSGEGGAGED